MSKDEYIFREAVVEAMERNSTLAARVVYVQKKLKRVEQRRLLDAKDGPRSGGHSFKRPDGTTVDLTRKDKDLSMLEKHRAEHYFLALPFVYQLYLVDRECALVDPSYARYAELPVQLSVDAKDLGDEAWNELGLNGGSHES